jgi:type I restriction enzyme M protein
MENFIKNTIEKNLQIAKADNIAELDNILQTTKKEILVKLKDTITNKLRGKSYGKDKVQSILLDSIPYIGIRDLKANSDLNIQKIYRKIGKKDAQKVVDFSAILVSLLGANLKPTYFNYQGQAIITSSDILALEINKEIDIQYFMFALQSRLVQIQLEILVGGNVIQRIYTKDFLEILIIIPPIEEQQRLILQLQGIYQEKNKIEQQLIATKEEVETTEYDVLATVMHNLNQKLGSVRANYDALLGFLRNAAKSKQIIDFATPLRPLREGEKKVDTLETLTQRLENHLLDSSNTIRTTQNILQKQSIVKTLVNFAEFLQQLMILHNNDNFEIEIKSELPKNLEIEIDNNALQDAFRNLIENAKKHGFTVKDKAYIVGFEAHIIETNEGEFLQVICKNNGKPFPKNFTFEQYCRLGGRAGQTKGTGLGGYFVRKVVELHKGKFSLLAVNNPDETFKVQFEILLPLL